MMRRVPSKNTSSPTLPSVMRRRPGLLLLTAGLLLLAACSSTPEETPETEATPEEFVAGLDFAARDLAGDDVHFASLRGDLVLMNFWASWCPPCQEEMPVLQAYYEEHADEDFVLLGMNVSDQPEAIAEVIERFGLTFPIWRDPLGDIMMGMNVSGLPTSILFDDNGVPVFVWLGPFDQAALDEHVTPLLGEP